MLPSTNTTPTMTSTQLSELLGIEKKEVNRKIKDMFIIEIDGGEITPSLDARGYVVNYHLNELHSTMFVAKWHLPFLIKISQYWIDRKNQKPALPSMKELALMVVAAEEEKEAALLLVEQKSHHIESLESLFHSGGTIAQFAKQLNGINCHKINLWLNDNTNWLYDENKGKVNSRGQAKPYAWRCASYARDKYLTERPVSLGVQGVNEFTKYEVTMLAKGKKWLFKKYINGDLDCCMKSNWDGKYTQEKDIK